MNLFSAPGPRWFTIPAHRPFVEDLAAGLLAELGSPEALADCTVLVPTRRGARSLAEAFVKAGEGRATLLPQILALGDLDEGEPPFEPGGLALDLPPAVTGSRRRFELARLVADHRHLFDRPIGAAQALELGDALAGFLDSLQIEEATDLDRVASLVEGDLARHWLKSARFLAIATEKWPQRLRELGLVDVTERRTALLRGLADQWRDHPPDRPLLAAGSTGSAPATANLLAVIAAAPQGAVVLPGLDLDLADEAWDEIRDGHPQMTMRLLLEEAGVGRAQVRNWPAGETGEAILRGRSRRRVINEALRPAKATADWVDVIAALRREGLGAGVDPIAEGLEGLSTLAARSEEDAAGAAALLLREALETPGKTAALVTPDPALARRVSARLARWGVGVDSSAGVPLSATPVGALLALTAASACDPLDPVRALSILKNPLVKLAREGPALDRARTELERDGLRGPRAPNLDVLTGKVKDAGGAALARDLIGALQAWAGAFDGGPIPAETAAFALTETLETLCATTAGGSGALWGGAAGEAAAGLISALMEEASGLPDCGPEDFTEVMERLLASSVVRTGGLAHPRLRILGAIEARLVRADRLVLAGLEEGVWPRPPPTDPFLSRPMRASLGLPPPERRTGLSAHDFAQAACAPEVTLIHIERRDGQPTVKSRWLWRLETLAKGAGLSLPRNEEAARWAEQLDAALADPPRSLSPARPPEPRPPVSARPRSLSVTRVEVLVRDPYQIYAERILKLQPLPRPDEAVEVKSRGTAIHNAFEELSKAWPTLKAGEAEPRFAELYIEGLRAEGATDASLARETTLAARAADWVVDYERRRRGPGVEVVVEQKGTLVLPDVNFTVTAKADRLEVTDAGVHIVDFKTGSAPSKRQVQTGFSPQLTLTAAIVAGGGFDGVGARAPGELLYVRITGREPAGEEVPRAAPEESAGMAAEALAGLKVLVARYDRQDEPYRSRIAPQFVVTYASDYDHLARVAEWSTGDEDEA